MAVDGIGVAYVTSGFVLAYAGVRRTSVRDTLTAFLKGQQPRAGAPQDLSIGISKGSAQGGPAGSAGASGSSIASDALQYKGHPYLYGGAPGPSGKNPWDCSSFCNWVLGHDLGMTLPGYTKPGYDGSTHGPTTLEYLVWKGATTVGNKPSDAQAGDLCVWQTHMGIAIGNGQMISALNEHLGTMVTTIADGAPGLEALFVRRVTG